MQQNQDLVDRAKVMKMMAPGRSDGDNKSDVSCAESDPEPAQLSHCRCSWEFLYCAWMARFDLLRITCKCATRVIKVDRSVHDERLLRLMRYISTIHTN